MPDVAETGRHGWTRFMSMQDRYNPLYREREREVLPLCADQGIGIIPHGRLTRDWDATSVRSEADAWERSLCLGADRAIVEAVGAIAGQRSIAGAQVALAWVMRNPVVTALIAGATSAATSTAPSLPLDVELTGGEVQAVEAQYTMRRVAGFS
jgi:1-deoxyxylulose-5-phosphate synthase